MLIVAKIYSSGERVCIISCVSKTMNRQNSSAPPMLMANSSVVLWRKSCITPPSNRHQSPMNKLQSEENDCTIWDNRDTKRDTYPNPRNEKSRLVWKVYAVKPSKTVSVINRASRTTVVSYMDTTTPTVYACTSVYNFQNEFSQISRLSRRLSRLTEYDDLFLILTNAPRRIRLAGWSLLFIIKAINIAIVEKNAKPMVHTLNNKILNGISSAMARIQMYKETPYLFCTYNFTVELTTNTEASATVIRIWTLSKP